MNYTVVGTWTVQDGATLVAVLPGVHPVTLSDSRGVWVRIVEARNTAQAGDTAMEDVDESAADNGGRLVQIVMA